LKTTAKQIKHEKNIKIKKSFQAKWIKHEKKEEHEERSNLIPATFNTN
jgi:hypothetical protein